MDFKHREVCEGSPPCQWGLRRGQWYKGAGVDSEQAVLAGHRGASENLEHGVETVLWTPECQGWKHPFENSCPAWKVPSLGPLNSELELAAFPQGETYFLKKDQSH